MPRIEIRDKGQALPPTTVDLCGICAAEIKEGDSADVIGDTDFMEGDIIDSIDEIEPFELGDLICEICGDTLGVEDLEP